MQCKPCKTVSGKIVPLGTISFRPLERMASGMAQHGIKGSHFNLYRANQNPHNGRCFWQPLGAVSPNCLPLDAIPIEPFDVNGGLQ